MKIEVEFISKALIKPSSPTPHHLRHYSLSFLDQIEPPIFVPFIFFYPKKSNINSLETCDLLKQSLSQVLTIFYPLAGRIKNETCVDCSDEGFLFVEAKANCQLSEVLFDRNLYNYKKFTPVKLEDAGDLAAFCQVTWFSCGGLALSFAMSHNLGDGFSHFMFLNSWAAIASGNNTPISIPYFGSATLFPPCNLSGFDPATAFDLKERIITKVFVFAASSIEALVTKYTVNGERQSRVVALTAFIWSRFIATTQADDEAKNNKLYKLNQAVNLRSRLEPPLQNLCFGNMVWSAAAEADMEAKDSYGIVKRMKDSIRNIDADTVKKLQNSDEQLNFLKKLVENSGKEVVSLTFSSVCGFPTHETDFGCGKPIWVATTPFLGKNIVGFMDSVEGKGIEAAISLLEEDMSKFEMDEMLLEHVSSTSNGNPFHAQLQS